MKAIATMVFTMFILGSATPVYNFGAASAQGRQQSHQKPAAGINDEDWHLRLASSLRANRQSSIP